MAKVITIGNFKGGVGKTSLSVLFSYLLETTTDLKTLLIDFDPQGNASEIIRFTYPDTPDEKVPLIKSLQKMDVSSSIVKVTDNLDLLPADWSLSSFPDVIEELKKNQRNFLLDEALEKVKKDYDIILIDVPPTLSGYTNNAVIASDYILMVLQTQQQAYSSSLKFVDYLRTLKTDYTAKFDLLGVVNYLIKKDGKVDQEIIEKARETFQDALYTNEIYHRERVKRYGKEGISNTDIHDGRVLDMYNKLLSETFDRIKLMEGDSQ